MTTRMDRFARRIGGAVRQVDDAAAGALEIPQAMLGRAARIRFMTPFIVAVGVIAIATSEYGNRRLLEAFSGVERAYEERSLARSLEEAALSAESAQRGYILTEKEPYLDPYHRARESIGTLLEQLRESTADKPAARALVASLDADLKAKISEMEITMTLVEKGRRADALLVINTDEGKRRMDRIRTTFRELIALENLIIERQVEAWTDGHDRLRMVVAATIAASVVLMIVGVRLMRRMLAIEHSHTAFLAAEQVRLDQLVTERTAELTELANHLQNVREDEKAALARELHDELGAILTAARMDVAFARKRIATSPEDVEAKLQRVQGYLDQSVALKRRIIEGMVPSVLHNLGLVQALEALCAEFAANSGLDVAHQLDESADSLSREQSLALYRVAQEAMTNVQKHARAHQVTLSVIPEGGGLRLTLKDDGVGTDRAGLSRLKSHGVRGMRQRMRALNGTLEIRTAPGQGTTVEAWIPRDDPAPLPTQAPIGQDTAAGKSD